MAKRALLVGIVILGLALVVSACDDDDDAFAPDSTAGRAYRLEITEGTGTHATAFPGTFRLEFEIDGTYASIPELES
ncbi:hypothetical protein GF339_19775 [candidate division KSB3 bacterium]|uniref:DUF4382 domain-containing protein n=1 Tax=candidate division KSB3 bacterium TaxID=2044937 RepID=A0A9D5Q7V1_9BACT|nr:hypothetical protein [candidate division KSB3 bacterium]MBD3326833.1 hypothetical protein [candidate division KSB3 bacterium]